MFDNLSEEKNDSENHFPLLLFFRILFFVKIIDFKKIQILVFNKPKILKKLF